MVGLSLVENQTNMGDRLPELREALEYYMLDMRVEVNSGKDFLQRHPSKENQAWFDKAKSNLDIAKEIAFLVKDLVPMLDSD